MKILYIRGGKTGFNERDLAYLNQKKQFVVYDTLSDPIRLNVLNKINSFIYANAVLAWFVGRHSYVYILLAYIFRKKIVVIAGGYDVAKVPEIRYGSMLHPIKRLITVMCLNVADLIVAVSHSNWNEIVKNAKVDPSKILLIQHCLRNEVSTYSLNLSRKDNVALTVGEIRLENLERKGHLEFAKMSLIDKNNKYVIAGRVLDQQAIYALKSISNRIEIIDSPNDIELNNLYATAKFYVQLSSHEAFGLSVLEAMHHGCNIIISNRYALPEVVADPDCHVENIRFPLVFSYEKAKRNHDRANLYYSKEKWIDGMNQVTKFLLREHA